MSFTVRAHGGLCNRLRVVLSYRAWRGEVDVLWRADPQIAGARWGDVFEPLAGVQFLEHEPDRVDAFTCDNTHEAPKGWEAAYRELRLLPALEDKWRTLRVAGPYAAIHARRTDARAHAELHNIFTTDEHLLAWCRGQPYGRTYVATDNGTTQRVLCEGLRTMGKQPVTCAPIAEHPEQDAWERRNTPLADSAIDLFMCAGAAAFEGSGDSSFTNTITMLRELGGWWA